jgi:ABC-type nickel/cobalt efflux system permease component RcnA
MNQTRPKRRKGWFWTGVGLLIGGGFWWYLWYLATYEVKRGEVDLMTISIAAILTGLGIFCIWRSRKPKVVEKGVSKLEEAASFAKREARRRKLWYAGQLTFVTLAIVFWNVFGYGMAYEKDAGIPMGDLITAAICTGLAIYCVWRRRRLVIAEKIEKYG